MRDFYSTAMVLLLGRLRDHDQLANNRQRLIN
jgi:hypothetical protein